MINYLSIKEFRNELKSRGINVTTKMVYHFINSGTLKAQKEILRPSRWVIPESEIYRVVNVE